MGKLDLFFDCFFHLVYRMCRGNRFSTFESEVKVESAWHNVT